MWMWMFYDIWGDLVLVRTNKLILWNIHPVFSDITDYKVCDILFIRYMIFYLQYMVLEDFKSYFQCVYSI